MTVILEQDSDGDSDLEIDASQYSRKKPSKKTRRRSKNQKEEEKEEEEEEEDDEDEVNQHLLLSIEDVKVNNSIHLQRCHFFRKFPEIRKLQIDKENFMSNEKKWQFIPYFSVQSGILLQLLSASYCGNCKIQEIWDSTCVVSEFSKINIIRCNVIWLNVIQFI